MEKSDILRAIIDKYTLSNTEFENLKSSYDAIAKWLADGKEINSMGDLEINFQGSLLLGTVVKPIDEEDDFDVDLLSIIKNNSLKSNPFKLKKIIGDRLKENKLYSNKIEEKKRCWTIYYTNRHVDILPCVPDNQYNNYLITTEKVSNEKYIIHSTNPLGYAKWFFGIGEFKKRVFLEDAKIKELTQVKSKNNLQKIVQLLKLHRNYFYKKNEKNLDDKPISIIISTLSALAYSKCNENDLFKQFIFVAENLQSGIEIKNGIYYINNPVDFKENFADKWLIYPSRKQNFFEWLDKLQSDCKKILESNNFLNDTIIFKDMFGEKAINFVCEEYGNNFKNSRIDGSLYMDKNGVLNESKNGIKVKDHTFYGKDK